MIRVPFITVEGPIGVGKTSLSKAISEHFHYELLKEIVDENPFLGKFYTDIEEWSFQTEMFFLCNRFKQLEDIDRMFLKKSIPVVADYHILKNLIFASRTLKDKQHDKYLKIYQILTEDMPKPNVVIYLTASLETLQKRIQLRGREFEQLIEDQYLLQLIEDYETHMKEFQAKYPEIPVLKFDGDQIDFVNNPRDLAMILESLENTLQKELRSI
ncbi:MULTISPECIES: deoxynucleoside kinase [Bacillaceae]|jgi:deoxyguanosine kinase|uniref:deoxynucleoside kinase n=1 Tax=Bacillaceae TaxID=186817 RepID=UPI0006F8E244|nr:deoxynucleoside kinase [Bacillus sp. FJAT-25509]KQL39089.1 deoxyguanosine kinase [Bacillus sp. FJAT-25509]